MSTKAGAVPDRPLGSDQAKLGVTSVSQVGTFGHGLDRTVMYETRCSKQISSPLKSGWIHIQGLKTHTVSVRVRLGHG